MRWLLPEEQPSLLTFTGYHTHPLLCSSTLPMFCSLPPAPDISGLVDLPHGAAPASLAAFWKHVSCAAGAPFDRTLVPAVLDCQKQLQQPYKSGEKLSIAIQRAAEAHTKHLMQTYNLPPSHCKQLTTKSSH